jgi:hypothetical protein
MTDEEIAALRLRYQQAEARRKERDDEEHALGMRVIKVGYDILTAKLSRVLEIDKKQRKQLKAIRKKLESCA